MACNQMSDCNPFFKEKGSVRFSALYLKKKRNLLVFTSVDMIVMTSMVELESLFGHLFDELSNGENQVVSKSSDVTTADAFDKRQQQQDSTSSTSTLATTITADGNFDLRSYALSWKPCQGDSLNLPDHRRRCCSLIPAESRFKTSCSINKDKYMMKAQAHVSKSSAISDVQALPQRNTIYKITMQ
ncbi:hypothetical protein Tco_0510464 [Tanacetum coccineum]